MTDKLEFAIREVMGIPIRVLTDEFKAAVLTGNPVPIDPESCPLVTAPVAGLEVLCPTLFGWVLGVIRKDWKGTPYVETSGASRGMLVKNEGDDFWSCSGLINMRALEKCEFKGTLPEKHDC